MNDKQLGATLPLVAFLLTALLGVAALAIDVGMMTLARQRAQAVADAAALAGAANAATVVQAGSAVNQVVAANNAAGTSFGGVSVALGVGNSVTVQGYVNAPLSFAPAVGYAPQSQDGVANTLSVPASATAAVQNVCSLPPGSPVAPFGLIGDDPSNADPAVAYVSALLSGAKTVTPGVYQPASAQVTLKLSLFDSGGNLVSAGSFDPLLISGNGVSYFNTIRQTSDQALSVSQTLPNAAVSSDNVYYTRQYLAARLATTNTTFYHGAATYDLWFNGGGQELPDGAHPEDRLLIVPVISQSAKNKLAPVTVIAYAAFFVDTPYPTGLSGNVIALGRFIGLTVPSGAGGACSGAGNKTLPRLTS